MFRVILCIQFYRLMQLIFSTSLKGIIRKECQSFTNHGHDITPPAVFNPLSLWLTLPRDMGVSHTLWPSSITGAILACLWFAQGLHSREITEACSFSSMLLSIRTCREYHLPAGLWRGNARDSYYLSMVILPASSSIQFSTAGSQ
jgi:hypothetical protein